MNPFVLAFRDYLLLEKKYSKLTQQAYCDDLVKFEAFVVEKFSGHELDAVEYAHVREWVVFLVDGGVSNVTINRKMASLKAFYKFLVKIKKNQSSPLLKHRALKVSKHIQVPFSENEMERVQTVFEARGFASVRDKMLIEMFYATGMRKTELIELKIQNVDLCEGVVKVVGKRNKERLIPLLETLSSLIRVYLNERSELLQLIDEDYFFVNSKGLKLSHSFVYRVINLYFSAVSEKVKKSPHILRHTFASHMLNNGADLNSVKELLGHSSLASTQVYTNSSLSELKKVYKGAHPRSQE